ncbi:MAG: hypothetical protein R3C26_18340 [Calditrichia bacterium]
MALFLGAALENATRTRLEHFALRNLFEPLGIDELSWGVSPEGRAYGGGMLMLTTRAMGKIGQLVLENGRRNELQIVPENWISQMCAPQAEAWGENAPAPNYGFGWWQTEIAGVRAVLRWEKVGNTLLLYARMRNWLPYLPVAMQNRCSIPNRWKFWKNI